MIKLNCSGEHNMEDRKVFQKFLHMNKHEFIQKIEYQKNKKFAAKTWSELI